MSESLGVYMKNRGVLKAIHRTGVMRLAVPLIFLSLLFFACGPGAAFSESGDSGSGPFRRISLKALPGVSTLRVAPPEHFLAGRARGAKSATRITINYLPKGPGEDTDKCDTWPADAKAAVEYAVEIWESLVTSKVPITINTCWATNLEDGALGQAQTLGHFHDFTGAPLTGTWYPVALANALHGSDLAKGKADMYLAYSKKYPWYFGTDLNTPAGKMDLVSVVLHEITHGLGFSGTTQVKNGQGQWGGGTGYPDQYDRFIKNGADQQLIDTAVFANPSGELAAELVGGDLYFTGSNASAANGGQKVKIYAPSPWADGSSYSHLDWDTFFNTRNALMVYGIPSGAAVHHPGPVTLAMLGDMGWAVTQAPYRLKVVIAGNKKGTVKADGLTCSTATRTCAGNYEQGKSVEITAAPDAGSVVSKWTSCASSAGNVCAVTMDADSKTVTVAFDTAPKVSFNPASLDFGKVDISGPINSDKIVVTNPGGAPLTITSVAITPVSAQFTIVSTNCAKTLTEDESCTVDIAPSPASLTSWGSKTASLSITSDAPKSPGTAKLAVNFAPPNITVSPTGLNFGSTAIGAPNQKLIRIKNTGVSTLTFTSVAARNASPGLTVDSSDCANLKMGEHCDAVITFTPASASQVADYIDITTNDPDTAKKSVPVKGKGETE
jgi:hypothetical protein